MILKIFQEMKYYGIYECSKITTGIFAGIGIVLFLNSLFIFNLEIFIKIIIGVVIGIFIAIKFKNSEYLREELLKAGLEEEIKRNILKNKNEKIRLWVEGSKNINRLVTAVVSLGMIMINFNNDIKNSEKQEVLRNFIKDIESFYELKEEAKIKSEEILQSNPNFLTVMKELKSLELSDWVKNEIDNLLWKIIFENGYLGTEEEKLLDSWKLYLKNENNFEENL